MSELAFYASVCSDVGRSRGNNEDNFSLMGLTLPYESETGRFARRTDVAYEGVVAVFDGMGGQDRGEVASRAAAELTEVWSADLCTLDPAALTDFSRAANAKICAGMDEGSNMGSTLALAAIRDGLCTVANIGDSRVYLWRQGRLRRLSRDHTAAAQLIDMGVLDEDSARTDSRRHQLTQHLGIPEEEMVLQPEIVPPFTLEAGDRLLLCSDGVTDGLSDRDLATLLAQDTSCDKMAGGIVDSAMLAGSRDNITAVVVKIGRKRQRQEQNVGKAVLAQQRSAEKAHQARRAAAKEAEKNRKFFHAAWGIAAALAFVLGAVTALIV